jgi:hypothetical protein
MYLTRADWDTGVAVWWSWGVVTDEEWERAFDDMRAISARSAKLPFRPCVLLYLDTDRPDALRRKQLAELADDPRYNPYIACVTRDPQLRGVQVAMRWLGERPLYDKELFDTVEEGVAWLELKRGAALPTLRRLVTSVTRLARQMSASSSQAKANKA